jgi:hypothetical protein
VARPLVFVFKYREAAWRARSVALDAATSAAVLVPPEDAFRCRALHGRPRPKGAPTAFGAHSDRASVASGSVVCSLAWRVWVVLAQQ